MTPSELQIWTKQNESTSTNIFPKITHEIGMMGIALIYHGIKLLTQGDSNDNP